MNFLNSFFGSGNIGATASKFPSMYGLDLGMNLANNLLGYIGTGISNSINRQREDTAVQRRMTDLENAGVNPLMAITGNVSSASSNSLSAFQPTFATNSTDKYMSYLKNQNEVENLKLSLSETQLKAKQVKQAEQEWEDTKYKRTAEENQYKYNASLLKLLDPNSDYTSLTDNPNSIEKVLVNGMMSLFDRFGNTDEFKSWNQVLSSGDSTTASYGAQRLISLNGYTFKSYSDSYGVGTTVDLIKDGKKVKSFSNVNKDYALIDAGRYVNKQVNK